MRALHRKSANRSTIPLAVIVLALVAPAVGAAADPDPAHPARLLIEQSEAQVRRDPDQSRRLAERALEAVARLPDGDLELRARLLLCDYHSERDVSRAEAELQRAAVLQDDLRRPGLRAGARICAGQVAESRGDIVRAREAYEEAVRIAEQFRDDEMLANALYGRGYVLGVQGNYAAGLVDLRRAQGLYEMLGRRLHSLTTLNSIAIIYNRMGDTAQAQSIYQRALQAQRAEGLRRETAVTLYNLGRAAENLQQWPAALQAYEGSLAESRALGYGRGEGYALHGLASVAVARGQPALALEHLARLKALQPRVSDARLGARASLAEGMALRQEGRLVEARAALERALGVLEEGDAQGELVVLYDELAAVAAARRQWQEAYEWRGRSREVGEGLLRRQIDERFATLKVEFDTATKDKENAALLEANEAAVEVQFLQAVAIALAAVLACVLAVLAWHQRRNSLRMRALALTDELTEAPNRRAVLRRLQELIDATPAPGASVLLLDIDHFKSINDRYGHPVGDKVLRAVAARLRASLSAHDMHGRIGGEEFLVIAPEDSLEDAIARAEVIRFEITTIETRAWFDDGRVVTVSIGVARSHPGDTVTSLLQRADAALYEAKAGGRNCVRHAPAPAAA